MAAALGCDGGPPNSAASTSASPPATQATRPITVASLVPACTDMLIEMGLADRLVGVSNYEPKNPLTDTLPRVGDYQTADWERLAQLRPGVMVVFQPVDRVPAEWTRRAEQLGIHLVNVRTDTLDDIRDAMPFLGSTLGQEDAGIRARQRFLDAFVAMPGLQLTTRPKVLLALGTTVKGVVGPGGFLDQCLRYSGGDNAASDYASAYPSIDREQALALAPDVVIVLLPGGSEAQVTEAKASWAALTSLPAVKSGRVHVLTDERLLLSGYSVVRTARLFEAAVNEGQPTAATPLTTTGPTR